MDPADIIDEDAAVARILEIAADQNGDDAAALRVGGGALCVSTDSTILGVHAPHGTTAHELGRRAAARALSDLAAMAAAPVAVTCAAQLPPSVGWESAVDAVAGVAARSAEQDAPLVGGDLTRVVVGSLGLVVTVIGRRGGGAATPFVTRSGARPGHLLVVTGTLGAAGAALARGEVPLPEPPDRIAAGLALGRHADAMVDLSDGLARDAMHVARGSGCTIDVDLDSLPVARGGDPLQAVRDGDDYELLAALPPARLAAARADLARACPHVTLTVVGGARAPAAGEPCVRFHRAGRTVQVGDGFQHR